MSQLELQITKVIPASREQVYDAWLDPKALAQFMLPGPGMSVPKAEVDARVGGAFAIVMKMGDTEIPHDGVYRALDRPRSIVFTWSSPHADNTVVTLTFRELGPKETELTLHHSGFANAAVRDNHDGGWKSIVEQLARTLG